ncbi:MAG: patatin-like phospholipase family protein [Pseudomonadota bacterium]
MKSYQKTIFTRQIFIALVTYLSTTMLDASVNPPFNEDALNRLSMLSINSPSRPSSITLENPANTSFSPLLHMGEEALTHAPRKTVRILSLDGGGARGIVEAEIIRLLEERLNELSPSEDHVYLSNAFHLIGGTSAGALLATFLTTPSKPKSKQPKYTAENLFSIIHRRLPDMFEPIYTSLGGRLGTRYKVQKLHSVIEEYLGEDKTNNTTTHTAIFTYDINMRIPKIITSWDREVFIKADVTTASSAAPTYFDPCVVSNVSKDTNPQTPRGQRTYTLIDGGVVANNPTFDLVLEAKKLYPEAEIFEIVSIGSGRANKPLFIENMHNAGILSWGPHLSGMFTEAQSLQTDKYCKSHYFNSYTRLTPLLSRDDTKMDNVEQTNIETILCATRTYFNSEKEKVDILIERLLKPKTVFQERILTPKKAQAV